MKTMELFALEVQKEAFEQEEVFVMDMPKSWKDYFKKQTVDTYKIKWKVEGLGKKLRSIFPEIIGGNINYKILNYEIPWIVSTKRIPEEQILQLSLGWLASFEHNTISQLPSEIRNATLIWKASMLRDVEQEGGVYSWIPGLAAIKFCAEPRYIEIAPGIVKELEFHHVVFNGIHECVSAPIMDSNLYDPFSYVIKLSLEYRGGEAERLLLMPKVGMRKYLKDPKIVQKKTSDPVKCYLKKDHPCSVLVSVKNPFSTQSERSFSQLKFERITGRRSDTETGPIAFSKWQTAFDDIYWDVLHGEAFEPDMLMANPLHYLQGKGEITAWVVNHHSFDNKGSYLKPGLGLSERSGLFNCFKEAMASFDITPLPHIEEIPKQTMNDRRVPMLAKREEEITIEFYGSPQMYEKMIEAYTTPRPKGSLSTNEETLFSQKNSEKQFLLNSDRNVVINFVRRSPEGIVSELEISTSSKQKAYDKKISQIKRQVQAFDSNPNGTVISLVEIDRPENWPSHTDPKQAIREAMRQCDRITQFLHPNQQVQEETETEKGEKAESARMVNALLDLLNDAGLLSHNASKLVRQQTKILTFDIVKFNKEFCPAVTRMEGTEVSVKLLGINEWMEVREAFLKTPNARTLKLLHKETNNNQRLFLSFMTRVIEEELSNSKDRVLVLVKASLRNKWLKSISNNSITYDQIPDLSEKFADEPRLVFVRVHASSQADVPQYRIANPAKKEPFNKESGIFKDPQGIYYGIGGRPNTWTGVQNKDTKFLNRSKMLLQQTATEYIPLGNLSDVERDDLANLVDQLRRVGLTYDKHTQLPYTFRILKALSKYGESDEASYPDPEFEEEIEMEYESETADS